MKADGGLNIERLEVSPDQKQLLVGFRSPLRNGRVLIARVENLAAVFDSDETPEIAPVVDELDLGGRGIRGLSYIPAMGAHLIIGGPATREEAAFDLWCWSGQPGARARRVKIPGMSGLAKAEGVSPALIGGMERIIFVSDDGNRDSKRSAGYLLFDHAQRQIED